MPSPGIPIVLILSCALLGGYGGVYTSIRDGFFDALKICTAPPSEAQCILNTPQPYQAHFKTNIPRVDALFAVLFEFFSQGVSSDAADGLDLNALLAGVYLVAQFGGAWYLIALEGLRRGNANKILSWTGTFGIVFQFVTITLVAPIYLTIQLLSSSQPPDPDAIAVDTLDLGLIPISTTIAFILPTAGLALSLLNLLSSTGKYFAIALWQPFPLYQTAVHAALRFVFRGGRRAVQTSGPSYKGALGRAYGFALFLTMGTHLLVLGTIVLSFWTDLVPQLSPSLILLPSSLTSPPTLALSTPPVSINSANEIVISFLRWDVYCASAALSIWASYLAYSAGNDTTLPETVFRALFWVVAGGPVAPAVVQLWQRDAMVSTMAKIPLADEKGGRMTRSAFRSLDH